MVFHKLSTDSKELVMRYAQNNPILAQTLIEVEIESEY